MANAAIKKAAAERECVMAGADCCYARNYNSDFTA
jgi:hypothetical protein